MRAGPAAVCPGEVLHRRHIPTRHEFRYAISYVWLDPDRPDDLCRAHPLWSDRRASPARFRAADYGDDSGRALSEQVRDRLGAATGHRPSGEIRMLTQVRRFGWLFNPITVYVAWHDDADTPVGLVLEVTNTPWKERSWYALALQPRGRGGDCFTTDVDKMLHVSPFLDEAYRYEVTLTDGASLQFAIDVVRPTADADVTLETLLRVERVPADRRSLQRELVRHVASTHRVSMGIHLQAIRLWLAHVPVVPHPSKRAHLEHDHPEHDHPEQSAAERTTTEGGPS